MIKKLKVLFVGSFLDSAKDGSVGGQMFASKSLIDSSLKDNVDWVLLDSTANTNRVISFNKRLLKSIKRTFVFLSLLIFKKIDIALIFTGSGNSFKEKGLMANLAKLFGIKVILAPRSGFIINDFNDSSLMKQYIQFTFNNVDKILCQGESWKKYFISQCQIPASKMLVIQNWIDTGLYEKSAPENEVPNILYLAWVDTNKGIFDLIEAIKRLSDNNVPFNLNVSGDGNAMPKIKSLISKYNLGDKVILHGWVIGDQKMNLLKNSDIFILPSHFEGFPNALLEAMASGIASIATDVGSVKDIIIHNENGLIIPPNDSAAIEASLKYLLINSTIRKKLGRNARKTVLRNNSIQSAVSTINQLFKDL